MVYNRHSALKRNNFDLLRLVFAATVCLGHVYDLSRMRDLSWIAHYFSSAVAVKSFFVVSGFLIFMSYERSSSNGSYFIKRLRRIYPAYAVVILITAFFFFLLSTTDPAGYFSTSWLKFLGANLMFLFFLQPDLPMLFESHQYSAVNGALWTLKIEVMFYCCVPFFVHLMRRYSILSVLLVTYILSIVYSRVLLELMNQTGQPVYGMLAKQLPGQLTYFMGGAFFFYFFDRIKKWLKILLPAALLVLVLDGDNALYWLEPFALAAVVVSAAFFIYLGNFGKYGDFSYGLYICHFPIIQTFIHFGWFSRQPDFFLVSAVLCSLGAGILMWHLVEKRFLLKSSHYRAAAE